MGLFNPLTWFQSQPNRVDPSEAYRQPFPTIVQGSTSTPRENIEVLLGNKALPKEQVKKHYGFNIEQISSSYITEKEARKIGELYDLIRAKKANFSPKVPVRVNDLSKKCEDYYQDEEYGVSVYLAVTKAHEGFAMTRFTSSNTNVTTEQRTGPTVEHTGKPQNRGFLSKLFG